MAPQPIQYALPAQHRRRWTPCPWHITAALIALAFLALPFIPLRQTRTRVDAVTGSLERQTEWPLGITTKVVIEPSPLELRLQKMGVTWTRDWHGVSHYGHSLFGNATRLGCGSAPPVFHLRSGMADFTAATGDAEILEFVRIMQKGTHAEQRAAVDAAWDAAFKQMTATLPSAANAR